jgi:ribonuclease BN (tRNA processing enzyme)
VEHEGHRIVLDLGAGALGNLQRHCELDEIDAVFLSHLHADHCVDLAAYYYARRYHPSGSLPPLPVYGPPGTARRVAGIFEHTPVDQLEAIYTFHEHGPGTYQVGPFTVTAAGVAHPVDSYGLRIEAGGGVLAYSGDTAACQSLVEIARDADLFLCEASWPSTPPPPPGIHLTGVEAGAHAALADVKRLLLTHVMPFHDPQVLLAEAKETYDGPVELVAPGNTYRP